MTIEQADRLAEIIKNAPHMYDDPPSLNEGFPSVFIGGRPEIFGSYPWLSNFNVIYGLGVGSKRVYYSPKGFSSTAYESMITDWDKTVINEKYPKSYGARYITIDDLKMMVYLGMEYAKAKLEGWQSRIGDVVRSQDGHMLNAVPQGYIVRSIDNKRYISKHGTYLFPPGYPQLYSDPWVSWREMKRFPGYKIPEQGAIGLPSDYEIPDEATSEIVNLGSIVGNNDVIRFTPYAHSPTYRDSVDYDTIVEEGGFEIFVTTQETISDEDVEVMPVVYQQRVYKSYLVTEKSYDSRTGQSGYWQYQTLYRPSGAFDITTQSSIESNSGLLPLRQGLTYNVFAKFDSAVLKKDLLYGNQNRYLVSYVRMGTRMVAPSFNH